MNDRRQCDTSEQEAIDHFTDLCEKHDLTYTYSDDHRAWTRGREEADAIAAAALRITYDDAARIWNAMVERKILPASWADFKWSVK